MTYWETSKSWFEEGGLEPQAPPIDMKDPKAFYYRMNYDNGKFESAYPPDVEMAKLKKDQFCHVCKTNEIENIKGKIHLLESIPKFDENGEEFEDKKFYQGFTFKNGITYRVGDAIYYVDPNNKTKTSKKEETIHNDDDHHLYPEAYRKSGYEKGSNKSTNPPFDVGIIEEIRSNLESELYYGGRAKIKIRCLFRPAQLNLKPVLNPSLEGEEKDKERKRQEQEIKVWEEKKIHSKPLNLLYWTQKERSLDAEKVMGKCFVRPLSYIEENCNGLTVEQWTSQGENRFYYTEMYEDNQRKSLDSKAENYGLKKSGGGGKGKGKSSGKSSQPKVDDTVQDTLGALPNVEKLRCLDVFAGKFSFSTLQ